MTSLGPQLEGDALKAVEHRGSHLQIIASAGSGKTEVVSQRVADLLAEGVEPEAIVAFTFTERAAAELKERIAQRTSERLGSDALDRLNGLYVGTIHAYCFRLLQQHIPRYETYDVLDDNQLTALLARESNRLDIRQLDDRGRMYASISAFLRSVDVVENELLDPATIPAPFGSVLGDYYATLERYRLLTYGLQIVRATEELERLGSAPVRDTLRHLIVDEYQDVNPAQERLIELLAGPEVELCVVGDDQQAIYQWRGSDVANIVTFSDRYKGVAQYEIAINRRSRPGLIEAANQFAESIPNRISKPMAFHRPAHGDVPEIVAWSGDDETEEAGWIAQMIMELSDAGVPYADMAVLVRGRSAYPRLVEHFATFGIPVQPDGRTGLFEQPEARALGMTFTWLADVNWKEQYSYGEKVTKESLLDECRAAFRLSEPELRVLGRHIEEWKEAVSNEKRTANLVGEFYDLLELLQVKRWDSSDAIEANRLGTLARFSALLADYESTFRRSRPDPDKPGEQVGGVDRGIWYYKGLGIYIANYANRTYAGFDGEPDFALDAVNLLTVHRAKGLEWPVVFVPSMTKNRFPSSKSGKAQDWLIPREMFNAARYEGGDSDERRLFYVAMTRARDWLSVSRHERVTKKAAQVSPYFSELAEHAVTPDDVARPSVETVAGSNEPDLSLTFSELALFIECGHSYHLRNLLGFQPRLAAELGYGKAVHHVLRTIAETTRETGLIPDPAELDRLLDDSFFLPTANKPAHKQLKAAARRLIGTYTEKYRTDLRRVWETERPFELHLEGVTISGRADVILDREDGVPDSLAIVDYKTSTSGEDLEHALQLQIYADAGRREGLDVRAAFVHDLKASSRAEIKVGKSQINDAEKTVRDATAQIKVRNFAPRPGAICRRCEVRTICPHSKH